MPQYLHTLSRTSFRRLAQRRLICSTPAALKDQKFPHETLEQGHASTKSHSAKDPQGESVKAGLEQRNGGGGSKMDAASPSRDPKTLSASSSGNPERVGFAEQVGGASSTADKFASGERQGEGRNESEGRTAEGDEEAQPAGLFSSVKRALGFKNSSGEVKQNHGGGGGVTGTGSFRGKGGKQQMHTSAVSAVQHCHVVEKDAPSPADYMTDVAQELAKSRSSPNNQCNHDLTHRFRDLSEGVGKGTAAQELRSDLTSSNGSTVSPPKDVPGSADHASGEWSNAGLGDKHYRNVGVEEEPYEPPADDEDNHSKVDARHKKLRYGGLAKDPKLV